MKAVILAAGKGLRMKPLTETIPKPLIKIKGKSFLERQLIEIEKAGIKETIIVIGYLGEQIKKEIGNEFNEIKIKYITQKKQRGTADGVNCVKELISEDFIQINGDLIFEAELISKLINKKENVLVLRETANIEKFGLVEVEGNKVKKIIEKPNNFFNKGLINAGIYRFTPEIFNVIEKIKLSKRGELELTDAINLLAEKNKVSFIEVKEQFFDIGTIKDLEEAEKEIK